MKPSKYRSRLAEIEGQRTAARKMEILKLSHMTEQNPDYVWTRATGFTLFPEKNIGRRESTDGEGSKKPDKYVPMNMTEADSAEDRKADVALFQQIRSTSDYSSLFTGAQLSGMSLEQKMLAGLYKPRIKKDRQQEIEFV